MEKNDSHDVNNEIQHVMQKYYETNSRNVLFKKSQKSDCAKQVSVSCDIYQLLDATVYTIPGTNKVYIDYLLFKTYAHDDNYNVILTHIFTTIHNCIEKNKHFEIHVNLSTFSVSALERHKKIIDLFWMQCMTHDTPYCTAIDHLYIYNTPMILQNAKMLMKYFHPDIKQKIVTYDKANSEKMLIELLAK